MTLTEFLLARIAKDEQFFLLYDVEEEHRAWLLAECKAKRRIVEKSLIPDHEGGYGDGMQVAVAILASVYADHPDFREEWRG